MMDSDDLSSFGTLLKVFRTRRGLTQHQLAEQLGVRRNTIGTWERGDFLPGSKGIVLELARHLHLDEQEIRQLLEASLTALAPHWSIPFRRNPFFTGREEVLEALHVQLGVNNTVALAPSSALSGLGGIGKTQIALEYAYRYGLEYSAVFWIGAETEEQIVSSFVQIAEVLQLLGREDNNHQRVVSAVKGWLSTHEKWLLVWDNVEELSLLDRFRPSHQRGALLLTTRRQVLATHAQSFPLHSMELDEGLLLLLRRAKLLPLEAGSQQMRQFAALYPASCQAASDLVETLGGLPLALDQAGAYLEATQCGVPAYLQLFHHEYASLLAYRGEGIRDHPESVDTTFQLAIRKAACFHPVLFDLLRACAFLHADAIPEELFRQGGEHLGAELAAVTSSDLAWNQLMASACGYSLLWRHPETNTLSLHRLVQQVVRQSLDEQEHVRWLRRIVEALNKIFPEAPFASEVVKQRRRCFPHVLTVTQAIPDQASNQALLEVLRKAADYLRDVSPKDKQAEAFYQRALRIGEQTLGPCHAEVAATLQGLAGLYRSQGKYVQAEEAYQRALRIREQTVGP
ncbi:MAG TPA: tetratricopeptide repeat protein, partial [Ktedonobacteraceae bacterium]|nr:tetratricopeptide repeat protein [Ktedonobacteraceae bacterium]